MFSTSRTGRRIASALGVALLAASLSPAAAHADELLPPPPVMPGFENVVIAPRPLSGPAQPPPATRAVTNQAISGTTTTAAKKAAAKKAAAKRAAKKAAAKKAAAKKAAAKKAAAKRITKKSVK